MLPQQSFDSPSFMGPDTVSAVVILMLSYFAACLGYLFDILRIKLYMRIQNLSGNATNTIDLLYSN
jgi:hypothetical protein